MRETKRQSFSAGDRLADLQRTINLTDMVLYGAATWDTHPLHYDRALAAARGLSGPVVDGQMLGALLAKQIIDNFGPQAFISKMSFRFRSAVFAGETIRCIGQVTALEEDRAELSLRIVVGERVVVEPASATVLLSS